LERSNIVRSFRWLCSWRGIRRVLIVLAWTVTIIGLWYGEENWRGRHAWNRYREATEARGVSLDYATYIPKSVPMSRILPRRHSSRHFFNPAFHTYERPLAPPVDHIAETTIVKEKNAGAYGPGGVAIGFRRAPKRPLKARTEI